MYMCRDDAHIKCEDGTDSKYNEKVDCTNPEKFEYCFDEAANDNIPLLCNITEACNHEYQYAVSPPL